MDQALSCHHLRVLSPDASETSQSRYCAYHGWWNNITEPYELTSYANRLSSIFLAVRRQQSEMPPDPKDKRLKAPKPRKPDDPGQPKLTDAERHKRFVKMAREVEADESPEAFDRAFKSVVRPKKVHPTNRPATRPQSSRDQG